MITFRSFFKFLRKRGIQVLDPIMIDLIRAQSRQVSFLTPEEIKRIMEWSSVDTSG